MSIQKLKYIWRMLSNIPGGKFIFSKCIGLAVPYSGSVNAMILDLKPGYARLQMKDRRPLRNHLHSVHAVALTNLGELCSGLAFMWSLPPQARGIVTKITTSYHKKARGTIIAESISPSISTEQNQEIEVEAFLYNQDREKVCSIQVLWRIDILNKA